MLHKRFKTLFHNHSQQLNQFKMIPFNKVAIEIKQYLLTYKILQIEKEQETKVFMQRNRMMTSISF